MTSVERPRRWPPYALAGLIVLAIIAALRFEGRIWWCKCGQLLVWVSDVHSAHCSQHLLDAYAFTHVLHGVAFYGALAWLLARVDFRWRFLIVLALESAWEILENSLFVIDRYRTHTAALGYEGDSVVNSLGDILACMAGAWFAHRLGWKWSLALWITLEVLLLFWIRDNLFLNVYMLLIPSESLKAWQAGG
ncbi:hypothetical protein AYO47_02440 [Planctomyces sp. SCGC AG-212-M04]|nr:hypothetical protein AYO47_02440 [Planctomyces sp. SCGC AG-212-M04]